MSNTYGNLFRVSTFGESHGRAIGCIVDGCPAGLELSEGDIQKELDRRRPGRDSVSTPRKEADRVEIMSGVFEGRTLGTPIALIIRNTDADSAKYREIKDLIRPGHADYTWREKYGFVDWRGGGRSSGRETASRVAAGAIALKLLKNYGIEIVAYSKEIAKVEADPGRIDGETLGKLRTTIESNPARSPDKKKAAQMEKKILDAKKELDSVGGIVEAVALGVPAGLGEPLFDKLDARLAQALMSIPSVKGVEIGAGFECARMRGSKANDPFRIADGRIVSSTNNSGGILGGISNGMPLIVRAAIKPTASISAPQKTVNYKEKKNAGIEVHGRHDPCIVPRAVPVVESMIALVLADYALVSGYIPRRLD